MKKARMGMQRVQKGFTLIELMIVVAIIGILAAIAIPQYQDYVAKSQVSRAVSELAAYKTAIEDRLNNGVTTITDSDVGFVTSNLYGTSPFSASPTFPAEVGSYTATLDGTVNTAVKGATIKFSRDGAGNWSCVSSKGTNANFKKTFGPQGCLNTDGV